MDNVVFGLEKIVSVVKFSRRLGDFPRDLCCLQGWFASLNGPCSVGAESMHASVPNFLFDLQWRNAQPDHLSNDMVP